MIMLTKLRRWWQRNFGCVYLSRDGIGWYKFRSRFGRVAFVWNTLLGEIPFLCELDEETYLVLNRHDETMSGYGRPYGTWQWSYTPYGPVIGKGGFW